jgi:hypothetical protein
MSIYIQNQNPIKWVETHGIIHNNTPQWKYFSNNCLPVVVMFNNNSNDNVAAIACNEKDYKILIEEDKRLKIVAEVPIEDLTQISKLKI